MTTSSGIGVIQGGWEFVWAAYAVSAAVFLGYALSVHLRYRAERARREREQQDSRQSHEQPRS
jgi:heme exporter protein CcmD